MGLGVATSRVEAGSHLQRSDGRLGLAGEALGVKLLDEPIVQVPRHLRSHTSAESHAASRAPSLASAVGFQGRRSQGEC